MRMRRRPITLGRGPSVDVELRNTPRGTIRVSTPEATCRALVELRKFGRPHSGGVPGMSASPLAPLHVERTASSLAAATKRRSGAERCDRLGKYRK